MPLDITPDIATVFALVVVGPLSYKRERYLVFGLEQVASHARLEFVL